MLYSKFHTNEDESSVEAHGKRVRPSEIHSILRSRLASHRTVSMRSDVACIDWSCHCVDGLPQDCVLMCRQYSRLYMLCSTCCTSVCDLLRSLKLGLEVYISHMSFVISAGTLAAVHAHLQDRKVVQGAAGADHPLQRQSQVRAALISLQAGRHALLLAVAAVAAVAHSVSSVDAST